MATAAKKTAAAKKPEPTSEPRGSSGDGAPAADTTPTPDEARAMFEENPGLAHVLTTEGSLSRDGILTAALTGA